MAAGRELTPDEFKTCFTPPMTDVTGRADAVVDIWTYVDALDLDSLRLPSLNDVQYVYEDAGGRFHQVLIGTGRFNALLVVVVDVAAKAILGHHVLDLAKEYGVAGAHLRPVR